MIPSGGHFRPQCRRLEWWGVRNARNSPDLTARPTFYAVDLIKPIASVRRWVRVYLREIWPKGEWDTTTTVVIGSHIVGEIYAIWFTLGLEMLRTHLFNAKFLFLFIYSPTFLIYDIKVYCQYLSFTIRIDSF